MPPKKTKAEADAEKQADRNRKIAEIKAHPNYAGYNLSDLDNARNVSDSKIIICSRGHNYTNDISHIYGKWPRCRFCGGSNDIFTMENEIQIAGYRDCNGGKYAYKTQDGRIISLTVNGGFRPIKSEPIFAICGIHGDQPTTISELIREDGAGRVCTPCNITRNSISKTKTTEEFIKQAMKVHSTSKGLSIYDYSKTEYIAAHDFVTIICPTHGDFKQDASSHLAGHGCAKCANERLSDDMRSGRLDFVFESQRNHVNSDGTPKYDYSRSYINKYTGEVEYTNVDQKVTILCPVHGKFKQRGFDHKFGNKGCTYCGESKGSYETWTYLETLPVIGGRKGYKREKKYPDLKYVSHLRFDFYLKKFNALIEFNGEQHYMPVECWGGEEGLRKRNECDAMKVKYCADNNIPLLVIKYDENIRERVDEFIKYLVNR